MKILQLPLYVDNVVLDHDEGEYTVINNAAVAVTVS